MNITRTTEDQYIDHLAGNNNGTKTIGSVHYLKASKAQHSPTMNSIYSKISGTIDGIGTTAIGLMAYPLTDSAVRSSIFGNGYSVCSSCYSSVKSLSGSGFDSVLTLFSALPREALRAEAQRTQDFVNTWYGTLYNKFNIWATSSTIGVSASVSCVADDADKGRLSCRVVNYISSVVDTAMSNPSITIGATVALVAYFAISKNLSYEQKELQNEKNLVNELKKSYDDIALRLQARADVTDPTVQQLAQQILGRAVEINKEIDALGLPNTQAGEITQSVFATARAITHPRMAFDNE